MRGLMSADSFFSLDGPLDTRPADGQVRAAMLYGLPALLRGRGVDPRPLFERHEIDPQVAHDPDHFVDCQSIISLL